MNKKPRKWDIPAKVKIAADHIVWKYQMGHLSREDTHKILNELNSTCFSMYNFSLFDFDPGETQEYIHTLQEKYTTVYV